MITDNLINSSGTNVQNETEIDWQIRNSVAAAGSVGGKYGSITLTDTGSAAIFNSSGSAGMLTTGTFTVGQPYMNKQLINVVVKDITVEISYRESATYSYIVYTNGSTTPPDRVWKEIYGLKDGKMTLLEVIQGKHIPAHTVEEKIVFDDDPDADTQ